MTKEMNNLLTRLDKLIMEAHEKGYSFMFSIVDDENDRLVPTVICSEYPTFDFDIVERYYINED